MSFAPSSSAGDAISRAMGSARANAVRADATVARRWLFAAAALFLLVKLAWVVLPAAVMGVPRLGDDALVYLWSGASSVVSPRLDQPAIRDIVRLRRQDAAPPPELEHARARVTMRTTGVTASPVALFTQGLLQAGAGPRLAFALVEAAIALALCVGIGYGLGRIAGPGAAAGALWLLPFAILPNQGLHYLVPSVFVLSVAMVLWATVLRHPGRWPLIVILALTMLLSHPIGPVYLLVAMALVGGQLVLQRSITRERIACFAALGLSVPLWLGINAATGVRAPMTAGLGGLSLAGIPANFAGLAGYVKILILTQPVVAALTAAGLVRAVLLRRRNLDAFLLAGVLLGVVLTTVVVDLPGYPGELPSRALIALAVVCTGLAAGWVLEAIRDLPRRAAWMAAAVLLAWGTQWPMFASYGIDNINSRHQIYDSRALRAEVAALPADAAVVWVDTDVALMAGLLAGADRLHAVPYPMLAKPGDLQAALAGASSVYVVTTSPERLNGLSVLGSHTLRPRFYGWDFGAYSRITLEADRGAAFPALLRIEGNPATVVATAGDGHRCTLDPARTADALWYRLSGCDPKGALRIESDDERVRLTGLAMGRPDGSCAWPWGQPTLRVLAQPRRGGENSELHFSYDYLLGERTARALQSHVGPLHLHSCRSGLVWLRAGPPSRAS